LHAELRLRIHARREAGRAVGASQHGRHGEGFGQEPPGVADGVDADSLRNVRAVLLAEGALPVPVDPRLGPVVDSSGKEHWVEQSLLTGSSVLFDAVYVPGGGGVGSLASERDAVDWVYEAFRHCKAIAATGDGVELVRRCPGVLDGRANGARLEAQAATGLLLSGQPASEAFAAAFVAAIARHRFWERSGKNRLGAAEDRETRGYGAPPASVAAERHAD
jgi:catalase